jgi:hypothetical protein
VIRKDDERGGKGARENGEKEVRREKEILWVLCGQEGS